MAEVALADRIALGDLVNAYAHCVDRRDFPGVAALFTEDASLLIYDGQPNGQPPSRQRHGRKEIEGTMSRLNQYQVTFHFLGQHTATVDGDRGTGETYCRAYHVSEENGTRTNMVMWIRYLDNYVRTAEGWLIEERRLAVDLVEHRSVT
jgi:ketosteroid isomerase-like protein